jgi:heme oxygenase
MFSWHSAALSAYPKPHNSRFALREKTREVHGRLHGLPLFEPLLEREVTREGYLAILSVLYGFHEPIEGALCEADGTPSAMTHRRRVHLLRNDLRDLGLSVEAIEAIPLASAPAKLDDPGRFLGALYVREGSTLGGRMMAKRLDHLCEPGRVDGRRFLSGTVHDPRLWLECCAALEQAADVGQLETMITAAHETFAVFEAWAAKNAATLPDALENLR